MSSEDPFSPPPDGRLLALLAFLCVVVLLVVVWALSTLA